MAGGEASIALPPLGGAWIRPGALIGVIGEIRIRDGHPWVLVDRLELLGASASGAHGVTELADASTEAADTSTTPAEVA